MKMTQSNRFKQDDCHPAALIQRDINNQDTQSNTLAQRATRHCKIFYHSLSLSL
eukprot:c2469_g1_i1 orf=3-161(-)